MQRRKFLQFASALPFVGSLIPKSATEANQETLNLNSLNPTNKGVEGFVDFYVPFNGGHPATIKLKQHAFDYIDNLIMDKLTNINIRRLTIDGYENILKVGVKLKQLTINDFARQIIKDNPEVYKIDLDLGGEVKCTWVLEDGAWACYSVSSGVIYDTRVGILETELT